MNRLIENIIFPNLNKNKKMYKEILNEYTTFYSKLDAMNLKPAVGEIRKYQLDTFKFCSEILSIIENLELPYFPIGGSLIGQIRHKGFVPWDDDFDIGMMRKDFNSFKEYCEKIFIVLDNSLIYFSKNNRSEIWQKYMDKYPNKIIYSLTPHHIQLFCGTNLCDCVNIDIFPHDYYREDYTIEEHSKYLETVNQKKLICDNFKKAVEYMEKERAENPNIVEKSSKIYYGIDNIDSYILKHRSFVNESDLFPLKKAIFEDREIFIQNNPDFYAGCQYSDYKSMPEDIELTEHYARRTEQYNFSLNNYCIYSLKNLLIKYLKKIILKSRKKEDFNIRNLLLRKCIYKITTFNKADKYKELYKEYSKKLEFIKSIASI